MANVPTQDGYYWAQRKDDDEIDVVHYHHTNGVLFIAMTGTDDVFEIDDFVADSWIGPIYPQRK